VAQPARSAPRPARRALAARCGTPCPADSAQDRDVAAATADAIPTLRGRLEAGQAFYADVKARLPQHGRSPADLAVLPGVTPVLGGTDAEAHEEADRIRRAQVSPQTAIAFLEQVWGRELGPSEEKESA
jgi:alkanesulfonate monooxygenase SsuD/methylene tetrahydromethanopterin reductase-like flavin-dependent oxidoreductase (luciferase family)